MAIIVVDTNADTVADDGKTSLREALAVAATAVGHTDIVFSDAIYLGSNDPNRANIALSSRLEISGDVSIDGSLYNNAVISLAGGSLSTNMVTISAGARVTLRDLDIKGVVNGSNIIVGGTGGVGADGANGTPGTGYVHPNYIDREDGSNGTDGTDATSGGPGGEGGMAVAGIINNGSLVLERVGFSGLAAVGGEGGLGGSGGHGGTGGGGANAGGVGMTGLAGSGGDGGNGGGGGNGGNGGGAAAGIYNTGSLIIRDVTFEGVDATGGNGGNAGYGDSGGGGGSYGHSDDVIGATGGDGGDGGNGGNGGNGGVAAGAIWNIGTVKFDSVQSAVFGSFTAGRGGAYGFRGEDGPGGGMWAHVVDEPEDGKDGLSGKDGKTGGLGEAKAFVGTSASLGTTFTIDTAHQIYSDSGDQQHRWVLINVGRLGAAASGATSVKWTFKAGAGISAADFKSGHLPTSGTADLKNTNNVLLPYDKFELSDDGKAEGIESFTVTLSDPKGGVLGWSRSVTVYVTDEAPDANGFVHGDAPTGLKLSASSISEGSVSTGKTIGKLSTIDADKGDHFTYSLVDDANGAFAISGSSLKVANGVKLDYEQAHSQTVVVRSTDVFGNSFDKTISVAIKNVSKENVTGTSGADSIRGGSSVDKFDGKGGSDTLKGGGGNDWFSFTSKPSASNIDHIADFSHGHDRLRLDDAVFKHMSKGTLASKYFYAHATAHDKDDHVLYDKASGTLYYDSDGKGGTAAVAFAVLDNHASLSAGDISIV